MYIPWTCNDAPNTKSKQDNELDNISVLRIKNRKLNQQTLLHASYVTEHICLGPLQQNDIYFPRHPVYPVRSCCCYFMGSALSTLLPDNIKLTHN